MRRGREEIGADAIELRLCRRPGCCLARGLRDRRRDAACEQEHGQSTERMQSHEYGRGLKTPPYEGGEDPALLRWLRPGARAVVGLQIAERELHAREQVFEQWCDGV